MRWFTRMVLPFPFQIFQAEKQKIDSKGLLSCAYFYEELTENEVRIYVNGHLSLNQHRFKHQFRKSSKKLTTNPWELKLNIVEK